MFKRILAAGAAFGVLASGAAHATTVTLNNFQVDVSITSGCTITATNINFGAIAGSVLLTTAQTSTPAMGGLFTYQCNGGTGAAPVLTASTGAHASGTQPRMAGAIGTDFLNYTLTMPSLVAFNGTAQTGQITATIPTLAAVPTVDTYSDSVTLTMTY